MLLSPKRTWLERCSILVGAALVALGTVALADWWLGLPEVLQSLPGRAALQMNAAVGFAVFGAVVLALESRRRHVGYLALIPALIAIITLAEYFLRRDAAAGEWLVRGHAFADAQHSGRVVLAGCFLVASALLLWRASRRAVSTQVFTGTVVGSVLAGTGLSTLLGYGAGLPVIFFWGTKTATSPAAALGLLLVGLALVLRAWRDTVKADGEAPAWSPMPWVIGSLTLTTILWAGLRDRELEYIQKTTQTRIETLGPTIQFELERLTSRLERLAHRRADSDATTAAWDQEALELYQQTRDVGCVSISFLDSDGRTRLIIPARGNEGALGFNHFTDRQIQAAGEHAHPRRAALEDVNRTLEPALSPTTHFSSRSHGSRVKGAVIYAPVMRGDHTVGYVAAELAYRPFFTALTKKLKLDADYHIEIGIGGETIHESVVRNSSYNPGLTIDRSPTIANRPIKLSLTPADAKLAGDRGYLPEFALFAGFGISILLGLSVHLARSARAGQRAAELSNKRLFAENEERRRVEARLKVSDERLRLALDSTHIGIFEWSVAAGHVYYSPGLWAMLGYDHAQMPSTVEAWQSLIHPDDLPLYRRRAETQLNGSASFIEPEYRVRARNGDWRWVYTRAKSVATNAGGRPIRIIGTVQDITARREAEIALRESQSEARKLSLVAAKTDNTVLIGSPDGRIEWANEAFCRVMEYSLEEVVGRNPAHFMLGPETNRRTIARIRTAMARGQGISTDVVNYSKSGRKYHLHIEVQPVHGASGELQNFIAVQTDITARVETENQLRRAKADADDASRAKSDFLASMSHEIRTPMNGVIGMTSLLMETSLTPEQRDCVNTIRSSGEALLTIINDILDFSKVESGKMELEHAPFELALCIEEALDLFALQASSKHVEIGYHMAPDVPSWIVGDVTRLRQVIVNLVNNAVKFTPSGSISIEVRRLRRETVPPDFKPDDAGELVSIQLEFAVRDTGIGIPNDRLDRLFKAFSQVDSSTTRKYGGTGLGLAISQRLCMLMGGSIRVESTRGQGSVFFFTIKVDAATNGSEPGLAPLPAPLRQQPVICLEDHPVTQARLRTFFERSHAACIVVSDTASALAAAARLPHGPALLVVDAAEWDGASPLEALAGIRCPRLALFPFGQTPPVPADLEQPFATVSKPLRTSALQVAIAGLFQCPGVGSTGTWPSGEPPIGAEIPLEVLLAEDNAINQKVALRFLERLGYRAEAVANGLEALTALENRRYDLVLMDLQMPEMDGFEATRQIRARLAPDRQPKIVALTANAMQGDRDLCVESGMDDHISKPVKMHEIAAAIRRHFGKPKEIPLGSRLIG